MRRQNVLRQIISLHYAKATNEFHRKKKKDLQDLPKKIKLNPDILIRQLKKRRKLSQKEDDLLKGIPVHTIWYERDLMRSECHQNTLHSVFDYLGIYRIKVKTSLIKTLPYSLGQILENHDQIVHSIKKTEFESLLSDEYDENLIGPIGTRMMK